MNLSKIQKSLIEKSYDRKTNISNLAQHKKNKQILVYQQNKIQEALVTIQRASKLTQNSLSSHISGIVTKALMTVFENPYEFKTNFVERRNTTEADLILYKEGNEYSILESSGYGVADICSFALRVAYIILSGKRRLLVFDEPFRHLDEERQPYAAQLVNQLSEELGIQFIIATHSGTFYAECENIFVVTNKKGEAKIKKVS